MASALSGTRKTVRGRGRQRAVSVALAALILVAGMFAQTPCGPSPTSGGVAGAIDVPPAKRTPASPYNGLGVWVDLYDDAVFDYPESAVRDMSARGVRTIYVETSNSGRTYAIKRPASMRRLIRAAHARDMEIVAWYLPTLRYVTRDYDRCKQAIRFRTADGQRFDGFALDIESSAVMPVAERNARLLRLSRSLRAYTGRGYPLGAIIPSPVGIQRNGTWVPFPFEGLAAEYDAFLLMGYFTYHGNGAASAYSDTMGNMRILRAQPGCARTPVHIIGGIASRASEAETRAFVKATRDAGCCGASLYDYQTSRSRHWAALEPWARY